MALVHHSNRNYNEAASDAAARAKAKMQETIRQGLASAQATVAHVMENVPTDALVRARAINVDVADGAVVLSAKGMPAAPTSDHALSQLCARIGMPRAYLRELLVGSKEHPALGKLAEQNLATLLREGDDQRFLVRAAQGEWRGVMSDAYKRIDARPTLEAFMNASTKAGLVPVHGIASETKTSMRALLPVVFEPAPNEVICFGLNWQNSDFGAGANSVDVFMLRLWCTNYAISERALKQIHIGKRLDAETFSQRTQLLEAKANISAVTDIVTRALAPERVDLYLNAITQAASQNIDANKALDALVKSNDLSKGERKLIGEKFTSADVEMLPPGNSTWRLSNAISWFAHAGDDVSKDRRVELERLAGKVLPKTAEAKAA